MLMGKNSNTKKYETVVQLLLLSAIVLTTPFLALNLMDNLELFSVFKSMLLTIWSSIKPWLYPPYVYLLINFFIFFIFASSFIHSNTTNHHNQSFTNLSDDDESKFHKLEDTFKDVNDDLQFHNSDDVAGDVMPESVVDKRELRKSKTFEEGRSRPVGRRERYVRILSQEELDRRVEAFIYRFKKDNKV